MPNGDFINGKNNKEVLTKLLQKIGLQKIETHCASIFGSSLMLSKIYQEPSYGSCIKLEENNINYYLYLNISKNDALKKIEKIREILKLNIVFIQV